MRYRLPAALATLTLLLGACANAPTGDGGDTPTPTGAIGHATGADQVLLKVSYEGGFVAPSTLATRLPAFALYGDGTILMPGAEDTIYPGPALPSIVAQVASEDGIQAILQAAVDAGLERDGDYGDMGQMGVADAATTVFVLQADGQTHRVSAYALGMEGSQQPGQPDAMWAMRRALQHLVERLGDLDTLVPAGSLGPDHPYEATSARLFVAPYQPDAQLPQAPVAWPLESPLAGFGATEPAMGDATCGMVTGDDWSAVQPLAEKANQLTPWTSGGKRYAITFRPLLPDETGC